MIAQRIKIIMSLCGLMTIIHIVNISLNSQLNAFGIIPGNMNTLPHVFTAPFLHGDWTHLVNNVIGLAIFSALSLIRGVKFFVHSSVIIIVLTGIAVWLFARSGATHIGASGWIFGLWSLSIAIAWFQRSFLNIVIAVFVAVFYGGMVWGVLPTNPYVSFESHLFGAIAGIVAAYILTRKKSARVKTS